jgi:hypothetical protein
MNYTALNQELASDPFSLGFAPLATSGSDSGLAGLLNAVRSGADFLLTLTYLDKNQFLTATTPAAVRLAIGFGADDATGLTTAVVAKWNAVLAQARAADPGSQVNLGLLQQLGSPVADNVMTADEFAAMTRRQGSRAEVLFGPGTTITSDDVATALRGGQ